VILKRCVVSTWMHDNKINSATYDIMEQYKVITAIMIMMTT
jgi:hypothetical protein